MDSEEKDCSLGDTENKCVCGEPATTTVVVEWKDAIVNYQYCRECAHNVVTFIEGAVIQ